MLAFLAHPGRVLNVRSRGFNEGHPCPSPEATFGCSNSFLTNLSLRRRLDATRMILCIYHNKNSFFSLRRFTHVRGKLGESIPFYRFRTMKKKRPVLQDVADRVGVTKMTVSRFLRNPEQVSVALRGKIAAALDELGYIPNRAPDILSISQRWNKSAWNRCCRGISMA